MIINPREPRLYVLVGVPGSGKSTWVAKQAWAKDCAYVSTDKWVEDAAKLAGKTYSEIFDSFMNQAVQMMVKDVIDAREDGKDIIWDQTSTTVKSRKRKFMMLPNYHAIAVVFKTPEKEELAKRLASRPGKEIPDHVVKSMIDGFEMPTEAEGFKEIWFAE
jgi:predicted kinase